MGENVLAVREGISIHALCEEGDLWQNADPRPHFNFYPRPLRGGRPAAAHVLSSSGIFLSTPSARRATCFRRQFWTV